MSIIAPVILLPTSNNYTTDIPGQTLSGTTDPNTESILVNNSTFGVSYTAGEIVWAWSGTLSLGVNTFNTVAMEKTSHNPSTVTTIQITLIQSSTFITVSSPTGIQLKSSQNQIQILNVKNPESQVLGYNYYVSTQSGGINDTYALINPVLVTQYSYFEDQTKLLNTATDTVGNIRVTTTTEEVDRVYFYSYDFTQAIYLSMVNAGTLPAVTFSEDTPFFFVVTAVIYDSVLGQVSESAYSAELQGSPITITTGIQDLPSRTQNDVILTFSQELLTSNAGIDTLPGTVVRDMMDPISEEMARYYVIQDFLSNSLSVSTLLDFDDPNHTGSSALVASTLNKQALKMALNMTDDTAVQNLINSQFDKLASNVNVIRLGATPAVGTVTFYIQTPPVRNMSVNQGATVSSLGNLDQGIPSQNYTVLETKTLDYTNLSLYYNSSTNRYELMADVQALNAGSAGNTDSYTITSISSGVDSDFSVENPSPISFGQDTETNYGLSTRIELALYADTGTTGGYAKTAVSVPGVRNVQVIGATQPLMIRDYDPVRNIHVGGKVDLYIQGRRIQQVSDQLAFSFESIGGQGTQTGEVFIVVNAPAYQFKSQNPRVGPHTPIFDVTKVHNATRNADYDITNYQIIDNGDTIDLNETLAGNINIGLASTDVIRVDYKFRSSDTFILQHQPVLSISSIVGQISGLLTSDNWDLVQLQDPLDMGGSTISQDAVRIKFANGLPVTQFQTITDEPHVLILNQNESLNFVGADPESIVVKSTDHATTYVQNTDYRIIPGTDTVATALLLLESGNITNGQSILVSYVAIENFIITYTTNSLLEVVQEKVNAMKHACADAVIKQDVQNSVDMTFTVVPKIGITNTNLLSSQIRTAIANLINQLGVGGSLSQSAVVRAIQTISDVNYVVLPMSRMVKADGSFITRDQIGQTQFQIYNVDVVTSYTTVIPVLTYATVAGGGSTNDFRGVFENSQPLVLQTDPLNVSGAAGRAYIQPDGRIVVSTKDGQLPDIKSYQAAYFVYGEKGSKDINAEGLESLILGNLTIVFGDPS
jgi:Baseplate J-like protein.